MNDYIINNKTLAIIPANDGLNSLVYEVGRSFVVLKKPNSIIKKNCIFNGSSLEGRIQGTYNLTGYSYKVPVLVSNKDYIIFFPTSSLRLKDCAWICLNNIKFARFDEQINMCKIYFKDNTHIAIDQSVYVINTQILKSTRLCEIIRNLDPKKV